MRANFNKLLIEDPYILFNCLIRRVASRGGDGRAIPGDASLSVEGDLG